jgi:peroxiredoxin
MKTPAYLLSFALCLGITAAIAAQTPTPEPYETYTKVGGPVPQFKVVTIDGKTFDMAAMKGKVVVLNLWATWCGPCKQEMPRLESEVWKNSNPANFAMVAIAREETNDKIAPFRKSNNLTFPMAADPDRSIYKRFASAGIPRTYVIGRDGVIKFQSLGYVQEEFSKFKAVLKAELARAAR